MTLARAALTRSRIVALLGPRQAGKTTLAREFSATDSLGYFDLEDPAILARLDEHPRKPATVACLRIAVGLDRFEHPGAATEGVDR